MTNYFVVFAPNLTPAQEGAFALNLSGIEWWHHLPGCWLIVDYKEKLTAAAITDFVKAAGSGLHCAVFKVDPVRNWSTFLPKDTSDRSRDWIRANWIKSED